MRRRSVRGWAARALVGGALLVASTDASAQPTRADEAIEKGREGVAMYERGEWEKALALFRQADALFHSPVLSLYAARSQRNLGKLLEAQALYEVLAREAIEESAPRPWIQAQLDGTAELKALLAEIPSLHIEVTPAEPGAQVSLDGHPVPIGEPIAANPGEHRVEAALGARRASKVVSLRRGEKDARIILTLAAPSPPDESVDGYRVLGVVLTGVGGASLLAGAVTGGFALGAASSAEESLPATCTASLECLPSDRATVEAQYDSANTLASVADGLLIGGGIVAAAGIVILILDPGGATVAPAQAGRGGLRLTF